MPVSQSEAAQRGSALFPILKAILAEVAAGGVCVYTSNGAVHPMQRLVAHTANPASLFLTAVPHTWFTDHETPILLGTHELSETSFAHALLFSLSVEQERLGALVVYSNTPFTAQDADHLLQWTDTLTALLENNQLRERQNLITAVHTTARQMTDSALPLEIVELLRRSSPKVTTCVVMLYGPPREDMPRGPFDYLEVQGTWSKRRGSGIGFGIRLHLKLYPDLIAELNKNQILVLKDMQAITASVDPVIRNFLLAEHVRSAILLTLGTAQWPIGAIMIATDRATSFTEQEIMHYQMVGELLTTNALNYLLRLQRILFEQGRAALLDAVTDGVVILVPDTDIAQHEGRIRGINEAFSKLFKVGQHQAIGLTLSGLLDLMRLSDTTTTILLQEWSKIMVGNPSKQHGDFDMIHMDGYPLSIEWYSSPIYQDRRVMGRIYVFHDASAERTTERLRYSLIKRLSHELRTPLSSIQGFAQFLLDDDMLSVRALEYVQIIFDNALHLSQMFTDVISLTRADTGELVLNMQFTHLAELIYNNTRMLEERAKTRGQSIEYDLAENLPLVYVDPHYVGQVMTEVLKNAILYAPENSVIRIKAAYITGLGQMPHGAPADLQLLPGILVTVADDGNGFTADEAKSVFLPFYRGQNASSARIQGTGLGLTIARSLIELHRGKIWAETRRRGRHINRFHFILPSVEV